MSLQNVIFRHLKCHFKALFADIFYPDQLLQRNKMLYNRHKGETCFILGSGPSIQQQDLTKLAGKTVITQNHFHSHKDIGIINPRYHVVVPKYQSTNFDADWEKWLLSMNEKLPKTTEFIFDKNTKYLIDKLKLFENRVWYIRQGYNCMLIRQAPYNLTRSLMAVPTVLPECLAVAIYMGFAKIYLLGFDMNQPFIASQKKNVRFYSSSPIITNRAEKELDEAAMKQGFVWINYWFIWCQCNMLNQIARKKGIEIINATQDGLLEMFPRANFEEIINS